MKKTNLFITLLLLSISCLAQKSKEYDIILMLNSSEKEMLTYTYNIKKDHSLRFYSLSKNEENEDIYTLKVEENGKLQKYLKGSSSSTCCSLTFLYDSKKNKTKNILKIESKNIINFKDFNDVSFEKFLEILTNAKQVFLIDSGEKNKDIYYKAYEVSF